MPQVGAYGIVLLWLLALLPAGAWGASPVGPRPAGRSGPGAGAQALILDEAHLQRAPFPLFEHDAEWHFQVGEFVRDEPASLVTTSPTTRETRRYQSTAVDLASWPESRTGTRFSMDSGQITLRAPSSQSPITPGDIFPIPLATGETGLLEATHDPVGDSLLITYASAVESKLDIQGRQVRLLAIHATTATNTHVLVASDSGMLEVASIGGSSDIVPVVGSYGTAGAFAPPMRQGDPLAAIADSQGTFHVWTPNAYYTAVWEPPQWRLVSQHRDSVVQVLTTHILDSATESRIILYRDRTLELCYHTLTGACTLPVTTTLPAEVPQDGLFINAPATESRAPLGWLMYAPPGGHTLWRMAALENAQQLSWQPLRLPAGSEQVDSLRMVRVSLALGHPLTWVPAGRHMYLEPGDFRCPGASAQPDVSIQCGSSASSNWSCVPGRVLAPFTVPGLLCGGCARAWSATDPANLSSGCSPCTGQCDVCAGTGPTDDCLVCRSGFVLSVDPATGRASCASSCPDQQPALSGVCPGASGVGALDMAATLTSVLVTMPALPDPIPVAFLARTSLRVDPQSNEVQLVGPMADEPERWLAFPSAEVDLPPLLLDPADLLAGTSVSASRADFLPTRAPVAAYAESSVAATATGRQMLALLCEASSGQLMRVTFSQATAAPSELQVDRANVGLLSDCRRLERLGPDLVALMDKDHSQVHLFRMDPANGLLAHAALADTTTRPALLPLEWPAILRLGPDLSSIHPLDMLLANDPRATPRREALGGVTGSWHSTVLQPGAGRPGELVLSALVPSGGTSHRWLAQHIPQGGRLQGRTTDLPRVEYDLGSVSDPGSGKYQVLAAPVLGQAGEVATALVVLTSKEVGVAALHCPAGRIACRLRPAVFRPLARPLGSPDSLVVVELPAPMGPGGGAHAHGGSPGGLWMALALVSGLAGGGPIFRLDIDLMPPCPEGTFTPDCRACVAGCVQCTGPNPRDCVRCAAFLPSQPEACLAACPAGMAPGPDGACGCHPLCTNCHHSTDRYECLACDAGHVPGPPDPADPGGLGPDRCLACRANCHRCTAPGPDGPCDLCSVGFFLQPGSGCVATCPAGMWPDADNRVCAPCPGPCTSCSSASDCTACAAGHFLNASRMCQPCDSSCTACTDRATCTICRPGMIFLSPVPQQASLCGSTCPPGEYVGAGRCAACDGSCELCAGGPDRCRVCAAGFRWGATPGPGGTGTCVACEPGCASCTSAACLSCEAGLLLTAAGACVSACPAGSFSNGESCQPCDISCAACADGQPDQCTGCAAGLELVEVSPGVGTCVSGCSEGQYRAGAECLPCDAACATCNGPTDKDCWRCASGVLQGGDCVQACAARHVAVGDRCLPCHVSCAECMGTRSTECLPDCAPDLLALPAGQSPTRCVPACPAGYNTSMSGCRQCTEHCASCPESNDTCALCERGWLLASPDCVTECPAGSMAQGGLCATCHATCATCFGPAPEHCLSCAPGTPLMLDTSCVAACPGTHFAAGGALCLPCSPYCGRCSGPGRDQCTACPADRVLVPAGECLGACPAGQYADAGRVCRPCGPTCTACSGGPDRCTACQAPRLLHAGACVAGCPAGHFPCAPSSQCVACPPGCASCAAAPATGAPCTASCTACGPGLALSLSGACQAACPAGEYLPAGSSTCEACAPDCATCHGRADRCTACRNSAAWLMADSGLCASACPGAGFAMLPDGRACLPCQAGCEHCPAPDGAGPCTIAPTGALACPGVTACHRCMAGYLLLAGSQCVATCPANTFPAWDAPLPVCGPCHPKCAGTCTGPEQADCSGSAGGSPGRRDLALGLGLGLGLLLLLLLLALAIFLLLRLRRARRPKDVSAESDENSTVLNTIIEMSLPGAMQVDLAADFTPIDGPLGAGAQASVFAARAVGPGISTRLGCPDTVAIKQMKAAAMKPTQVALFQNEIALMWLLREHPAIVRLYGYSDQPPAIIMHRYQTDLATLLHSEVALSLGALLDIAQQWASGLEAMHANGVVHCDLKPANVFVSQQPAGSWTAALGDLGTSQNLSTDRSSALVTTAPELNAMTARYAAPEVLVAFRRRRPLEPSHLSAADIFSAAVLLWESLSRAIPWEACNFEQISAAVQAGDRPDVSTAVAPLGAQAPNLGQMAADLLARAWNQDPLARPPAATFRQVCASMAVFSSGQ
ncbi:TKL protein kinase [Fonticula alba]|uniref:TKL protein kinase n=1 Tax=Fonticula alba TaxID=691883 RepID=A0A058Z3M9_FONAL|nr:TKL protein kinase [Fonticula alba]KCV68127.1 TKL protein kinase [Fonticula alba]|eukprot:XP_009497501.1 TKL protein kinase [Fonticula alba]